MISCMFLSKLKKKSLSNLSGMEVFVAGHGLFGADHDLPASITLGVVSKIIKVNNIPVMIQVFVHLDYIFIVIMKLISNIK